ncbi:hypothetical protein D3C87_725620 [compost metagenome]
METYIKVAGRNYVAFANVLDMRDVVSSCNAQGYFVRVVEFANGVGVVEYWK